MAREPEIVRPRVRGWNGDFYWSTNLFNPVAPNVPAWLAAAAISEEVRSVSYEVRQSIVDLTTRPAALAGYASQYLHHTKLIIPTFTMHHASQEASPTASLFRVMIVAWQTNAAIGVGIMDHTGGAGGREGVVGNFQVAMRRKREPLRNLQSWEVTLVPSNYHQYWSE